MSAHATLPPALRRSLFLAGTDTGVGKTWVAARLLERLASQGVRAAGMKPVAAGGLHTPDGFRNEDALALMQAASVPLPYALVNPCCLPDPTSPHLAAERAGVAIDFDAIVQAYVAIEGKSDVIIVEGAGGWLAPVASPLQAGEVGLTMEDLALRLGLPVVLVVGIRLGCLNHALLSAGAIRRSGLTLAGWIANPVDPQFADAEAYVQSLSARLPEPLLWHVPRS